jgi:hypothetical protein
MVGDTTALVACGLFHIGQGSPTNAFGPQDDIRTEALLNPGLLTLLWTKSPAHQVAFLTFSSLWIYSFDFVGCYA